MSIMPASAACAARKRNSIECAFSELRAMVAGVLEVWFWKGRGAVEVCAGWCAGKGAGELRVCCGYMRAIKWFVRRKIAVSDY